MDNARKKVKAYFSGKTDPLASLRLACEEDTMPCLVSSKTVWIDREIDMIFHRLCLPLVCFIFSLSFGAAVHSKDKLIATHEGLSAVIESADACGDNIEVRVNGNSSQTFSADNLVLQRLTGATRAGLQFECPRVQRIELIGYVDGQVVFRGETSQLTDWTLLEISDLDHNQSPREPKKGSEGKGVDGAASGPSTEDNEKAKHAEPQMTRANTKLVQRELNAGGFDAGIEDGLMGQDTRAAIRLYQNSIRAKSTGYLTQQQFDELTRRGTEIKQVSLQPTGNAASHPDKLGDGWLFYLVMNHLGCETFRTDFDFGKKYKEIKCYTEKKYSSLEKHDGEFNKHTMELLTRFVIAGNRQVPMFRRDLLNLSSYASVPDYTEEQVSFITSILIGCMVLAEHYDPYSTEKSSISVRKPYCLRNFNEHPYAVKIEGDHTKEKARAIFHDEIHGAAYALSNKKINPKNVVDLTASLGMGLGKPTAEMFRSRSDILAIVSSVKTQGPAWRSGLKKGDILVSANEDHDTFVQRLQALMPGSSTRVQVLSGPERKNHLLFANEADGSPNHRIVFRSSNYDSSEFGDSYKALLQGTLYKESQSYMASLIMGFVEATAKYASISGYQIGGKETDCYRGRRDFSRIIQNYYQRTRPIGIGDIKHVILQKGCDSNEYKYIERVLFEVAKRIE